MPNMIVYITRHGQPDYVGKGRYPLTELGRRQADRLGAHLAAEGFTGGIISSPFTRCLETADRICAVLGTTFRTEPAIAEKTGDWVDRFQGLKPKEVTERYGRCADASALADWPWWPAQQEELEDVLARVGPFLDRLVAAATGNVLLVGHGASCRSAFLHLSGEEIPGHHNTGLSKVRVRPRVEVLARNDCSHLGAGEVTSNRRLIR